MRIPARLIAVLALLLVVMAGTASSRANGVPQLVKLTYLDGVSNFGPREAEGVLEFSFAEAYARVEVKNLKPVAGQVYEGWLLGGEGAPFAVGVIPVEPSGVGAVEAKLEGLGRYDYNLFVVAVRPEGAAPSALPGQKSIAGRFTVITDSGSGASSGDIRPQTLPETGERAPGVDWRRYITTACVVVGTGLAAFGFRRRRNRRTA